jgi:hypothetical protein
MDTENAVGAVITIAASAAPSPTTQNQNHHRDTAIGERV